MLVFFSWLPSFTLHFTGWDILGYLAYQFTLSLIECIIVTLTITVLLFIIPMSWIGNNRISSTGALFVFSFAISAIIYKAFAHIAQSIVSVLSTDSATAGQSVMYLLLFSIIGLPALSIMLARKEKINNAVKTFVENLTVLVILYVTLSMIGVVIVIVRNIH